MPYKRPAPIRKDISKRDTTTFCHFHNNYGHDTNECNQLKDEIEFLIRQGHLRRYVRAAGGSPQEAQGGNEQAPARQRLPPLQPAPVAGTLLTIYGGPHLPGDSGKARERYARTLRHDQDIEMMSVEDRAPKKARTEEELITFSEDDAQHV